MCVRVCPCACVCACVCTFVRVNIYVHVVDTCVCVHLHRQTKRPLVGCVWVYISRITYCPGTTCTCVFGEVNELEPVMQANECGCVLMATSN